MAVIGVGALAVLAACGGGESGDASGEQITFEYPDRSFSAIDVSPDGEKVAYRSSDGIGELVLADGSFATVLPTGSVATMLARYLGDGSLAVIEDVGEVGGPVRLLGGDGSSVALPGIESATDLAVGSGDVMVVEQYDSRDASRRLVLATPDGTTALTEGPGDMAPDVSPDGAEVAFVRVGETAPRYSLVVLRLDGSGERVLLQSDSLLTEPSWSPDGTRLAIGHEEEPDDEGLAYEQVFVIGADGGGLEQVTDGYGHKQQPQWISDDELLFRVYSYTETDGQLFRVDAPQGS